ncbi:hypothetical protein K9M41_04665 [Candidatus Gracilibacteria bacterium]|nr:hypothetical protein [Candidatus Gracilibacteria bacterium]
MIKTTLKDSALYIYPQNRLSIWGKVKGMWKNKKKDPITQLKKIRSEW